MRYFILGYLVVSLLVVLIVLLGSFNSGLGYVYIQWLGWQIQGNILSLAVLNLVLSASCVALWKGAEKFFRRSFQQHYVPQSFSRLYPYERLGILWLLHAERVGQQHILNIYQSSLLLNPLIQARLLLNDAQFEQSKKCLKQAPTQLFEISELLKIDVALAEQNYAEALQRLEFLTVQPASVWLAPIADAYQAELRENWLQLSTHCPWWIFRASYQPQFNNSQNIQWLHALLQQSDSATAEDMVLLQQWYHNNKIQIEQYSLEEKSILLKLINQYQEFEQDALLFAQQILRQRFMPEVLYIWLDKSLNSNQDILLLEMQIQNWQVQYPAQPSLTFAQWHIYQYQHKFAEANQLLMQYPDDVYMAYLRVQDALQDSNSLQDDLTLLLQYSKQDFKFNL